MPILTDATDYYSISQIEYTTIRSPIASIREVDQNILCIQYPRGVWWWLGGCGLCGVGLVCLSGGGLIYESVLKIGGLIGFC
ncbi:hypothetical protein RCIA31 [Methanocella arvoryzae MRE50]|uniref:Uncharacterized protein n=1 Tax=Methanocella arvoryzae (strain DSM 22066 / NBRC 105507 / MRE50) TaxID=351160 RepID=Q0W6A8_METAR|nr:hypothetical protein RCIA31 [Methanocella arvoryzae MRE50]